MDGIVLLPAGLMQLSVMLSARVARWHGRLVCRRKLPRTRLVGVQDVCRIMVPCA